MSTALSKAADPVAEKRALVNAEANRLDTVIRDRMADISQAGGHIAKALAVGRAYLDIQRELTTQLDFVKALCGQANGFKADKEYSVEVIKRCAIDALIAGVCLTGNQFNIIGGNMYIAQSGWKHKLYNLPGFSFSDTPVFMMPVIESGTAKVVCEQSYVYRGEKSVYKYTALVRQNSASNIDNTIGKAKAKLWHALFEKLTGEIYDDAEFDDEDKVKLSSGKTSELANRIEAARGAKTEEKQAEKPIEKPTEKQAALPETTGKPFDLFGKLDGESEYERSVKLDDQKRMHDATK